MKKNYGSYFYVINIFKLFWSTSGGNNSSLGFVHTLERYALGRLDIKMLFCFCLCSGIICDFKFLVFPTFLFKKWTRKKKNEHVFIELVHSHSEFFSQWTNIQQSAHKHLQVNYSNLKLMLPSLEGFWFSRFLWICSVRFYSPFSTWAFLPAGELEPLCGPACGRMLSWKLTGSVCQQGQSPKGTRKMDRSGFPPEPAVAWGFIFEPEIRIPIV